MRVYLADRFSRFAELNGYRAELAAVGIEVTSRWLDGGHEWVGVPDDEIPVDQLQRFALEDIEDIHQAQVVVCFTEPSRSGPARGGRHFEAGYAYARGKTVVCVGHVENVFYALPKVPFFPDWESARTYLERVAPFLDARTAELQEARIP